MLSFVSFLVEAASEEQLSHLEHLEDHHINAGHAGFDHAVNTLHQVHKTLKGEKSSATISTKYDGSPSIVFGHHPESGKFFVSSKSVFNKDPKINYTHADIEKNHGHAPGLVSKLSHALTHLPKVTPKKGIYQGDFMYSKKDNDVQEDKGAYHFKPNTLTYSAKKGTSEGDKVKRAKIGVAIHTSYSGKSLDSMKAQFNTGHKGFGEHSDVHLMSTHFDHSKANYTPEAQKQYETHLSAAQKAHGKIKNYDHMDGHVEHLKTYINSTVREGSKPSVDGYREHLRSRMQAAADKMKTDKGKQQKLGVLHSTIGHVDQHAQTFQHTLDVHHHLQQAKNVLTSTMEDSEHTLHHSLAGQRAKPEGFVASVGNRPTKFVKRDVFSAANFNARPK